MSWDLSLEVIVDEVHCEIAGQYNYTHNTNPMIRAAGFTEWPYELDGMPAGAFAWKLGVAIAALQRDPDAFRAMNPENYWGDYDTLLAVLREIFNDYRRLPSATVRCSA